MVTTDTAVRAVEFAHHLIHRPNSVEGIMHGSTGPVVQQFGVSAVLPEQHLLFNDGPSPFHDLQIPAEALRRSALFVAHRYFRVPRERPAVFSTTEVGIHETGPWRCGERMGHLAMDMTLHPVDVVNGVPRGLECESSFSVEGVPCGSAKARMVFLMPKVYRNLRERGRIASRADSAEPPTGPLAGPLGGPLPEPDHYRTPGRPRPEAVGRSDPRNVVISEPLGREDGVLLVRIMAEPDHPVFYGVSVDHVPATVLMEAARQAALLLAAEQHGFAAGSCALISWTAHFKGFAEPDLPLYCAASSGELTRAADGTPALPVNLVLSQGSRQVGTLSVVVLQDC